MSRYLAAVLAAFVAASPAMAGPFDTWDSYGPAGKNPETEGYPCYSCARPDISEATYAQLRAAGVTFVYEDRQVAYGGPVYTKTEKTMLDEQLAASHAHDRRTYDEVVQNGGCNADFIPVYIAEYCNEKWFGNPMGSKGGD